MTDYVTVPNVEIVTAGIEWPASTGPVTVTMEHLRDAVTAGNDDPHIRPARVKIGHGAQLVGDQGNFDPFWDGQPAFGSLSNLRLTNDGAVLVADLTEVPTWLADAAPSAWPSRSMECVWDVQTEGGKRYSMVLTAISLLGPVGPAVKDLEDLQRLLIEGPAPAPAAASITDREGTVPEGSTLSVSTSVVRERFNFDWAVSDPVDGLDTYWWWARDIRVDPDEVIADDDEGGLWRVPFTTDGEDTVTFETPVRVRETFVDVPQPSAAADTTDIRSVYVPAETTPAGVAMSVIERRSQQVAASDLDRPTKPDPSTTAASAATPEEASMPDITPEQLQRLRALPEDADQDQINSALTAETEEETVEVPTTEVETPEAEREPEPIAANDRTAVVDRAQLSELQRDAQMGREAREAQLSAERDTLVRDAVRDGRIAPASLQAWRDAIDSRPDTEIAALAALTPGRIPVDERGSASSSETSAAAEGLPGTWFPQLQHRQSTTITQEA